MDFLKNAYLIKLPLETVSAEKELSGAKILVFFFSSSWCTNPMTEKILKLLKLVHKENNTRELGLEIIYVPLDPEETFYPYYREQALWYAIPPTNDALILTLKTTYGITHIPNIIVTKKDGAVISSTGCQDLLKYGVNVLVVWSE